MARQSPPDESGGRRVPDPEPPESARSAGPSRDEPKPSPVIRQIAAAQETPPVGLLLIGWDRQGGRAPDYDHHVEYSLAFVTAGCADRDDIILAAATREMAIIRAPLVAPAAAEGLARRIAKRLDVELDRLATEFDQSLARWAIGVAVGRPEDGAADLLRYAQSALDDAWLLGGRRMVAFDDGERGLLGPPP